MSRPVHGTGMYIRLIKNMGLPSQNNRLDLRIQAGQFAVDGLPDHFKVHLVVAVRNAIAHRIHDLPWNVVVLRCKGRFYTQDIVRRLANDLDVATNAPPSLKTQVLNGRHTNSHKALIIL